MATTTTTRNSSSARRSRSPLWSLVLSLVFHLLYTVSIFDIYFTSPVVHPFSRFSLSDTFPASYGARPPTELKAPADRLVLIVGDGLRADTLFRSHARDALPQWARADLDAISTGEGASPYPFPRALQPERAPPSAPAPISDRATSAATQSQQYPPVHSGPFLRSVALERGAWGVSHTRVPTESRPGHVAMIAGMYEDVSAVTKGWKLNPIAFDSLLNQSTHSYAFGSPDILPMFARGAAEERVSMWSYREEDEDFTKDATHLDLWVLSELRDLFARASQNATLNAELRRPGLVFFLHLLGCDTTGHTYRPFSPEYIGNAIVVDAISREVDALFRAFYNEDEFDSRTAFVMTADHGMSTKGNHGDGDPDNTRTPLLAWGPGVRGPRALDPDSVQAKARREEMQKDAYFREWDLENVWRSDVEQADIAPLMATLIGVPMPANSEGRLPIDYLDLSPEHTARASLANALEVLEQYRVKHESRAKRMLRFVPFADLPPSPEANAANDPRPGAAQVDRIKMLIATEKYDRALEDCAELIEKALQGSQYLQTYDWLLLVSIVTAGYLGSIAYGTAFLLETYVLPLSTLSTLSAPSSTSTNLLFATLLLPFAAKFFAEKSPVTYYLYAAFACYFWSRVISQRALFAHAWARAGGGWPALRSIAARVLFAFLALELMVLGYLERAAWTAGFCILGFVWPAIGIDAAVKTKHDGLFFIWGLCCVACGLFTVGGVDKEESIVFLLLSGIVFLLAGLVLLRWPNILLAAPEAVVNDESTTGKAIKGLHERYLDRTLKVLHLQMAVLALSTVVTVHSSYSLMQKQGLPLVNQVFAWSILAISSTAPFIWGFLSPPTLESPTQPPAQRLGVLLYAFAPIFVLLSMRDETLFYGTFAVTLLIWAKLEGTLYEERANAAQETRTESRDAAKEGRGLQKEDVRIALCFLFFLHVGFFGTGNVASISSFYLSPVYRLVPIFSPFLMAALLLLKILVPFLILSSIFHVLCLSPPRSSAIVYAGAKASLKANDDVSAPPVNGTVQPDSASATAPVSSASAFSSAVQGSNAPLASPAAIERATSSDFPATPLAPIVASSELPLFGPRAAGGLGLRDAYAPVLVACIATDVLALSFLFAVRDRGSWLEIGRTITHFAMANLLQVFMLALASLSATLMGGGSGKAGQ